MRALRLLPLLALTLTACGTDERASFEANGLQSLTMIVLQQWPWSEIELNVVVRGEPICQRHYYLKKIPSKSPVAKVYAYEASRYALLVGEDKYMFDVANCEITLYRDIPGLKEEDKKGEFLRGANGVFDFKPKQEPKNPE